MNQSIRAKSPAVHAAHRGTARAAPAPPAAKAREKSYVGAALIWVLIVFLTVPEGFDYTLREDVNSTGSDFSKATWIFLLLVGAFVLAWRADVTREVMKRINKFLLAFFVLAALSIAWSIEPTFTVKRVVRVLTILVDGMALSVIGWHVRRFQNVFRPVITLLLAGSIIFGLMAPELAIEQSDQFELVGAWHGLALQKNSLGSLAAVGTIFWLHGWLSKEIKWWWALTGGAISVACLTLSRSSTSLMAAVFSVIFLVMILRSPRNLRRYMPYIIGMFIIVLVIYSLAVLQVVPGLGIVLKPITMITGKDLTFSGRVQIWQIITEHIQLRPVFGSGYGAYWVGMVPSSPSYQFLARLYFYPSQSHNGYLDVINDLGTVGGIILSGYLIVYLRQSLQVLKVDRNQAALYLALLFQQLLGNLSEARWFSSQCFEFALMAAASASMARDLLQIQRAARGAVVRGAPAAVPA